MNRKEEELKDIQCEIVDILDKHKLPQILGYCLLADLTKTFEDYLKEEEGIDISSMKEEILFAKGEKNEKS